MPIVLLLRNKRLLARLAIHLPSTYLKGNSIWIHALSVGEVISALPLVNALRQKYPDRDIVFSVTTAKGMAIAKKELEGKVRVLITMPYDSWLCVRRLVSYIKPSVFVLIETDIWPALLGYLKKRGIRTVFLNGRISPRTFRSYQRFPFFVRMVFKHIHLCLMQSDLDRDRLLQSGIGPSEKVITVGNIKFDQEWKVLGKEEQGQLHKSLGLDPTDTIWVAGSTHPGEEGIVLNVYKRLLATIPSLRLIIAPRKVEQSDEVLRQAKKMGLTVSLKSELPKERVHNVLILNTLGELGRIYGLAEVSFVGGSLVPFGGHNLLEPASFGCPVVFGCHTHNFVLMSEALLEAGGGERVHDGEELYSAMRSLLRDTEKRTLMGRNAREFVQRNSGALDRAMAYIGANMNAVGG